MSNASLQIACELLEDIDAVEGEGVKGKVTKSFLRKIVELIDKSTTKEEYILSVAYMVARNKKYDEDDLVKFYNRLKDEVRELNDDWKINLKKIMQYVVKLYYIKVEDLFEEDILCTTK